MKSKARRVSTSGIATILAALVPLLVASPVLGQSHSTPQLIVKFRNDGERAGLPVQQRVALLSGETGIPLVHRRSMAFGYEIVSTFRALTVDDAKSASAAIARHLDVELAEPDYLRHIDDPPPDLSQPSQMRVPFVVKLMPNDQWLQLQPYLDDSPGGIDAFAAWDITTGSPSTVIAVVDSGVTHHVDLAGRIIGGYNFISNALITNGGPTRGPDFYDYGSWVTADDLNNTAFVAFITQQNLLPCPVQDSAWHGTGVTGVIAAAGNNGLFLAGLNWVSPIVVARFIGKCNGGSDSDQLDAMAWAAGLSVPGVPDNLNPAQIINMSASAGLTAGCNALWQGAVDQILAHGVTRAFVVAAGNAHADVATETPGSCSGVIAVAATDRDGGLASYSNFGAGITISAPGGDPRDFSYSLGFDFDITVLSDTGTTVPALDSYKFYSGTSFAAPMVSGVISLMLAVAPDLTPAQIVSILKSSAKPFPSAIPAAAHAEQCTTSICGAGILNAYAAVLAAQAIAQPNTPDLNQHGFTGSWYEAATSGQGIEVEIFPDQSPGAGSAFVSWFTYDTVAGGPDHQRWYTLGGPVATGQPNAVLTIYQNTDGNFNALPITNAQAVGTATLSFDTCLSGKLSYHFNDGRMGSMALTRLTQNETCSTTTPYPTNADFALSGNWFTPATSGQGFTVEVNPNSTTLFVAWYTYEPAPNGTTAGAAGQRWYTAQNTFTPGSRSIPVTIYETTGGIFDAPTPPGQQTVPVGTGTLAFQSCTAATFSYTFTGGSSGGLSGVIPLSRVGPVPPGCAS